MFNLKIEHVRAFLHVARNGGNKKAANALHLSQPAITARLKNLEALLGAELFDKSSGGRRLTKRGEMLLHYADKLEHLLGQIERDVAVACGIDQYLRIGVAETIAQGWMPQVVLQLRNMFPNLEIEILVDISPRLLEMLDNCEVDVAITHGSTGDQRMNHIPLPPVDLIWFTAGTDPVCDQAAARVLFDKPVITHPRNTVPYRQMRDAVWTRVGSDVQIFPSSSLSSALEMVATGVGVAALPVYLATRLEKTGAIKRFDPGWSPDSLHFAIHHLADPLDPIAEKVVELVANAARHHERSGLIPCQSVETEQLSS